MVHLVTDSTVYITAKEAAALKATVVSIQYILGTDEFFEGLTDTFDAFEERLEKKETGSSSQPSAEDFARVFAGVPAEDEVLCVVLSSRLSGTFNSASLAATDFPNVTVMDTRNTAGSLYYLLEAAHKMAEEGMGAKEIALRLETLKPQVGVAFTVDTLDALHRGGRIGLVRMKMGTLLSLRPILGLQDGIVGSIAMARGKQDKLRRLAQCPPENTVALTVHYLGARGEEQELAMRLAERFPEVPLRFSRLGPVLGIHLGLGAVGVAWRTE